MQNLKQTTTHQQTTKLTTYRHDDVSHETKHFTHEDVKGHVGAAALERDFVTQIKAQLKDTQEKMIS